jgi:carbohydrate-selective porin OprB
LPHLDDEGNAVDYANSSFLSACALIATISIHPAFADDLSAPAPIDASQGPQLHVQTRAADNGPSPITLRLQYTGEAADNAIGGLHNGATYMNNVLGQLHINTDKAFGWTGGSFVLEGFYENANSLDTQYVGAAQDPSVIDTSGVAMFRLYQAYYKQDVGNTNLLFGIYDLETEFGATRPMDIFFNGAYAWTTTLDQSGLNGPSTYPNTSLALRIREKFNAEWSVQAAVLDGEPDSLRHPSANSVNLNRTRLVDRGSGLCTLANDKDLGRLLGLYGRVLVAQPNQRRRNAASGIRQQWGLYRRRDKALQPNRSPWTGWLREYWFRQFDDATDRSFVECWVVVHRPPGQSPV